MLLQAKADFNIDLEQSFMVGDSENDIKAGKAAGCKTVLINKGSFGQDYTLHNLSEFVEKVLQSTHKNN